jgi:hypothetical protein
MGFGFFILVAGFALVLGLLIDSNRVDGIVDEARRQIEERGGQYIDHERRTLRSGPFMWAGKGQIILRIRYADASGQVRQLWVKRRGWPWGDDWVWDYDDGE